MGIFKREKRDYLQSAYELYIDNVRNQARNQFEYAQWCSWGMGAISVLGGMEGTKGCDKPPDNLDKARLLLQLGIQPMISIWYHNWESQESHADEEKLEVRTNSLMWIQTLLEIRSENLIKLYLCFDRQLMSFLSGELNSPYYYIDMFYQRYRECISGENIVEWSKIQFPIKLQRDLVNACYSGKYRYVGDPIKDVALGIAIIDSGAVMLSEFKRMVGEEDS
jgi:hypothetical protein